MWGSPRGLPNQGVQQLAMLFVGGALLKCLLDIMGKGWPPDLNAKELLHVPRLGLFKFAMVTANGVRALGDRDICHEVAVV